MKFWKAAAAAAIAIALTSLAALAADFPAPKEGTWIARDFKFHTGEVMPELRLAYTTVGEPTRRAGAGAARYYRFRCQHAQPGFRRRAVRQRPAARRRQVLHHHPGRDRPWQIGKALRRPARQVPQVQLRRHGRSAPPADQGGPRHPPPAPRDRQLHGRHAHMVLGCEIPRLHGRARAHGVAALRDGKPQLDAAPAADRHRPQRSGLQRRQLHCAAALDAAGQPVLRHRHQRRHAGVPEAGADARDRRQACRRPAGGALQGGRQRLRVPVGFLARLQCLPGPGADRGGTAGHQCRRRRAQSPGNRHHGARAQAREKRPSLPHSRERGDARPRHDRHGQVLEPAAGGISCRRCPSGRCSHEPSPMRPRVETRYGGYATIGVPRLNSARRPSTRMRSPPSARPRSLPDRRRQAGRA